MIYRVYQRCQEREAQLHRLVEDTQQVALHLQVPGMLCVIARQRRWFCRETIVGKLW